MSDKTEIVVGVDIGTTKICAIVARKNENGKVDILGMGKTASEGVMRGVVTNIVKTVEAISKAVEIASQQSDVKIEVVHVGIAGQHIRSLKHRGVIVRNNSEDEISKTDINRLIEDMHRVVMQPGEEIVHVIPQEYIVDNEMGIYDPIGMAGVKLEGNFHIITAQMTAVKNIGRCIVRAGLQVADLILEPIASGEAVLTSDEKEAGVALVDIGGGTTDLAIFKDGIIRHTAVIPLGGNVVTEDIKEGCSVMRYQAEQLKKDYGSAIASIVSDGQIITIPGIGNREPKEISMRNLAHIIEARMSEILQYIYREIINSGFDKKLIGGIVLTGGGAQLAQITHLASYITNLDARIGYPSEHLAKGIVQEVQSPMFATSVGLVLKALQATHDMEPATPDTPSKHATPRQGWFQGILSKGKRWLEDENMTDFKN